MSGYGSADDEAERAQIRVDELVALATSNLKTKGTTRCCSCGEPIPEARRKALPSARHCVDCAQARDYDKPSFKEPWAT